MISTLAKSPSRAKRGHESPVSSPGTPYKRSRVAPPSSPDAQALLNRSRAGAPSSSSAKLAARGRMIFENDDDYNPNAVAEESDEDGDDNLLVLPSPGKLLPSAFGLKSSPKKLSSPPLPAIYSSLLATFNALDLLLSQWLSANTMPPAVPGINPDTERFLALVPLPEMTVLMTSIGRRFDKLTLAALLAVVAGSACGSPDAPKGGMGIWVSPTRTQSKVWSWGIGIEVELASASVSTSAAVRWSKSSVERKANFTAKLNRMVKAKWEDYRRANEKNWALMKDPSLSYPVEFLETLKELPSTPLPLLPTTVATPISSKAPRKIYSTPSENSVIEEDVFGKVLRTVSKSPPSASPHDAASQRKAALLNRIKAKTPSPYHSNVSMVTGFEPVSSSPLDSPSKQPRHKAKPDTLSRRSLLSRIKQCGKTLRWLFMSSSTSNKVRPLKLEIVLDSLVRGNSAGGAMSSAEAAASINLLAEICPEMIKIKNYSDNSQEQWVHLDLDWQGMDARVAVELRK